MTTHTKTQQDNSQHSAAHPFSPFFPFTNSWHQTNNWPAVNVAENGEAFMVEVAAPGFEKEDFTINLADQVLTISSPGKDKPNEQERKYLRREFGSVKFERSFTLPRTVDADKIQARYQHGVLQLLIPKKEEARLRTIQVVDVA